MARIPVRRGSLATTLSLVLLAGTACTNSRMARFLLNNGAQSQDLRVEVINDNFLDMTVYAVGGGTKFRLGEVTGKSKASFPLDPDRIPLSHGLRLRADALGSREVFLSDRVSVTPGTTVILNLAATLRMSFVTLR